MSKIPEKIAYDAANAAYQKAWRADDVLRGEHREAQEHLLASVGVTGLNEALRRYGVLTRAQEALVEAEAATQALLEQREVAYAALVAARGG